jgi:hypothetical protein
MMHLIAGLLSLASPAVAAAEPAHAVGISDPLRRTLLDALRPVIEQDLGQPVIFLVTTLRVEGDWAYAALAPRTIDGAPIDFARTRHAERWREAMLDGDTIDALLRNDGGAWRVRSYAIGSTDVAWAGWAEEFGAPADLFEVPEE